MFLALFLLHGFLASRVKSAAYDEPGDIAAGLSYLQTGEVRANVVARFPALTDRFQPGAAGWLRRPPVAVVAHSWYVFDIP